MPSAEVLLCDLQPCDYRPVHRYLISEPKGTWELLLCERHRHELMRPVITYGRVIGRPRRREDEKLDELWIRPEGE